MIELYIKLKILTTLFIFLSVLFFFIIIPIKYKIDSKFKKNCFRCKYYKLHDVVSVGNRCRYKCILKNKICNHNFNDRVKFTKCKEFEIK